MKELESNWHRNTVNCRRLIVFGLSILTAFNPAATQGKPASIAGQFGEILGKKEVTVEPAFRGLKQPQTGCRMIEGSRVTVGPNSGARITLIENGLVFELWPNSTVAIEKKTCRSIVGLPPKEVKYSMRATPSGGESSLPPGRGATYTQRTPRDKIELQTLYSKNTLLTRPIFRWQPKKGAVSYRVTICDRPNHSVWQEETLGQDNTELPYPPDVPELKPDIDYFWTVQTSLADGDATGTGQFRILNSKECAVVADELHELQTRKVTDEALSGMERGEIYARHGLCDDAIITYQRLVEKFPDAVTFSMTLGALLEKQHRFAELHVQVDHIKALTGLDPSVIWSDNSTE